LKLLFITLNYPPSTGGSATNYEIFSSELIKRSNINQITILSKYIRSEKLLKLSHNGKIRVIRVLIDYKYKKNFIQKFLLLLLQNIQCCLLGIYIRVKKEYDIIQTHGDILWAKNGSIIHPGVFFLSKSARSTILDIRDKTSLPTQDLNYSHYLANSQFCYSDLAEIIHTSKISLIYSPLRTFDKDSLKHNNNFLTKAPYIVFIGTISKNKGISFLIDAVKLLNQNTQEKYTLFFCGELKDPLNKIPQNCIYLGSLDNFNAMKLLVAADLLVLPSKSESHPRVILESIYYNIPFLTTRGVVELEKHFPENMLENIGSEYIATRIKDHLNDPKEYSSTSYPIHLHHINTVIGQIFRVYKSLING